MYVYPKEEFYPDIKFKMSQIYVRTLINQPPLLDTTEGLGEAQ